MKSEKVLEILWSGKTLTPSEAREKLGIKSLRGVICRLKRDGYDIESNRTFGRNPVCSYYLASKERHKKTIEIKKESQPLLKYSHLAYGRWV